MISRSVLCLILLSCLLVAGVNAETTVIYADTNADARLGFSGNIQYFSGIISQNGNVLTNTTGNVTAIALAAGASTNYWAAIYGYGWSGNTSSIPDDAIIDSATFVIYGDPVKLDDLSGITAVLTAISPATPAILQASDWQTRNKKVYANNITYASWTSEGMNNFTFTDTSIIDKTGYTSLLVDTKWDIDSVGPAYQTSKVSKLGGYDTSCTGTEYDPFLEITYHLPIPVAAFAANETSGISPLAVGFTDSSTNTPTSWSWAYKNETVGWTQFSTDQDSHFSFPTGTYDINLTATNAAGNDDEVKTEYITVTSGAAAPVANFSGTPTSGLNPLSVTFTDLSTNTPTGWEWSWGDGTANGTTENPTHIYGTGGTFTVGLTASNAGGEDSETKTGYISVYNQTIANFTQTNQSPSIPPDVTITFYPLNSTNATRWCWHLWNGTWFNRTSAATANLSVTFSTAGNYTINLTTSDQGYGEDTQIGFVNVTSLATTPTPTPTPTITAEPTIYRREQFRITDPLTWLRNWLHSGERD